MTSYLYRCGSHYEDKGESAMHWFVKYVGKPAAAMAHAIADLKAAQVGAPEAASQLIASQITLIQGSVSQLDPIIGISVKGSGHFDPSNGHGDTTVKIETAVVVGLGD